MKNLSEHLGIGSRPRRGRAVGVILAEARGLLLELTAAIAAEDFKASQPPAATADEVINFVARFYRLNRSKLNGKDRGQDWTWPRHVACLLAREFTDASMPMIGHALGGRNHPAVLQGINAAKREISVNERKRLEVECLRGKLREIFVLDKTEVVS